jgi:predicted 3-demethylubiquinone-9 3-methyltransferase (glyoxalase superfamily)
MNKMTINLWFDTQAEQAVDFYMTVFRDGKKGGVTRYTEAGQDVHGQQPGAVMTVDFEMLGSQFVALNGGPIFKFNEAVSFIINCETQDEIDYYWEKLSAVPESEQCGWLKDKFGVSWQVVPTKVISELMGSEDKAKAERAMNALMQMKKIDIASLQAA